MWSRAAKRRERELAERLRAYVVVLAGDEADVLKVLRDGARRNGVELVEAGAAGDRPAIAVVAVRKQQGRSALARGLSAAGVLAEKLAPGSITVIVTVRGVAKIAPPKLLRALTPEILHQVEAAVSDFGTTSTLRNARQRAGLAALTAAGIDVLRVAQTG